MAATWDDAIDRKCKSCAKEYEEKIAGLEAKIINKEKPNCEELEIEGKLSDWVNNGGEEALRRATQEAQECIEALQKDFTEGYKHALSDMSGYARNIKVSYTLSEAYNLGYTQGKLNLGVIDAATAWENAIKENSYLDKEIPKEIAFFTCCDAEDHLIYTEPDEAIETFLDNFIEPNTHGIEGLPETITLYGFEPMEVTPSGCHLLADLLDALDAEYGNPDGVSTVATEKMKAAEKVFIAAVVAEYHPWAHERTWECEVDVEAWAKENMPEWME